MRKTIAVIVGVLFFSTLGLFGQRIVVPNDPAHDDKPVHFGFSLGLNVMDFYVRPAFGKDETRIAELESLTPGFNVQIISNFRISDDVDFRFLPGLVLGDRTLNIFTYTNERGETQHALVGDTRFDSLVISSQNQSAYLDFPLLIKYKTNRINNYRPYVIGGFNPRYDLSTSIKQKDPDDPYGGDQKFELQKLVPFYEVGFGVDFYMPYFKLGIELKYSRSLGNTLKKNVGNPYIARIDQLQSSMFLLSFHFE